MENFHFGIIPGHNKQIQRNNFSLTAKTLKMNHENDDTSPIEIDTDDEVINEDTNYAGGNNIDRANARMDNANYSKLKRHLIKITDTQKQIDDLDKVDRTFMIRMKEQLARARKEYDRKVEKKRNDDDYVKEQKKILDSKIDFIYERYLKEKEALVKRIEMIEEKTKQNETSKQKFTGMAMEHFEYDEGICLICCRAMVYPKKIFSCVNSHSVCSECKVKMSKCALCRDTRGYFRQNYWLQETIAQKANIILDLIPYHLAYNK